MPRQLYSYGTHHCRNLAGRAYADTVIRSELNRAGIPIIKCDNDGEVPSTIGGPADGVEICSADQEAGHLEFVARHPTWTHDPAIFTDSPWLSGRRFITSYHVDTIEGLRFLAKMIRRLRPGG